MVTLVTHFCSSITLPAGHTVQDHTLVINTHESRQWLLLIHSASTSTHICVNIVFACACQVAFQLTIPCMLLASTTKTLANCTDITVAAIPLVAILQIAVGALLGKQAAEAVEGKSKIARALLGWHPLHPTSSAAAVAASAAAALGAPAVSTHQQ